MHANTQCYNVQIVAYAEIVTQWILIAQMGLVTSEEYCLRQIMFHGSNYCSEIFSVKTNLSTLTKGHVYNIDWIHNQSFYGRSEIIPQSCVFIPKKKAEKVNIGAYFRQSMRHVWTKIGLHGITFWTALSTGLFILQIRTFEILQGLVVVKISEKYINAATFVP